MPDLEKDDMEHREDEVYEMSPVLEGDERESDEAREDEALLPSEREEDEHHQDVPLETASTETTPPPKHSFAKIEYLDGLRGMAAVWVYVQHKMGGGGQEFGFGQNGDQWYFVQLPVVRLFFGTGGNAAVVIFFVLSGYVLSLSSFRKLHQEKVSDCRWALLSALIRRPLRLYIPPIFLSFVDAMLLHVPGPLVLPLPWDGARPQEGGIWAEVKFFWEKLDYFSLFRPHASNLFAYPYNVAMWTIPIELKGSLLVFGILFILSLGMQGPDHKVPLMAALILFFASAIMLQREWKWSMTSFMFGMVLALVDTWPIGEAIKRGLTPPQKVRDFGAKLVPKRKITTPRWVSTIKERWAAIRSVRLTPEWLSKRLPKRSSQPSKRPAPAHKPTFFAYFCLVIGMYLLSEPSHAGDINFSANTPGWGWLTSLIPEQYGDDRYYRYWQAWASILVVYSVLRIPWLQRFFCTRPLKFLGYVSFMLYLIHTPFFRILPDRVDALLGSSPDDHLKGTFWDGTLRVPQWGIYCIDLRFWCQLAINLPITLLLAWVFTKTVDQPSVKLGKWITGLIGLDKKKPTKATTEGSVLPTTYDGGVQAPLHVFFTVIAEAGATSATILSCWGNQHLPEHFNRLLVDPQSSGPGFRRTPAKSSTKTSSITSAGFLSQSSRISAAKRCSTASTLALLLRFLSTKLNAHVQLRWQVKVETPSTCVLSFSSSTLRACEMASTTSPDPTASALTTIFTPPSSCLRRTYTLSPSGLDSTGAPPSGSLSIWRGYTADCFPSEVSLSDGLVYISPGICPSAYSIATQWTSGASTLATCCPWYMHASESHYDCASWPETTSVDVVENGTTIATSGYAWDTPMVIAWESKDLSLFPHHPTETGSWNIAKGITAPASAITTPPITVTDNGMFITAEVVDGGSGGKGLSTGAQAGIGVGVSLGVILAMVGGFLLFWRRRRAKKSAGNQAADDTEPAELPGSNKMARQLDSKDIHEKPGAQGAHEAGGYTLSHEMTGTEPESTFMRAELEGSTSAEMAGDAKTGLDEVGRRELEGDVKHGVLNEDRIELEGDSKEPPEYESTRDYTGDVAKVDR